MAALALLGAVFYAYLLPGHIASQFAAQLHKADLASFAGAICAPDSSAGTDLPETKCPICQGLASFYVVLAPPDVALLNAPPREGPVLVATRDDAALRKTPPPQSRGPPHLS